MPNELRPAIRLTLVMTVLTGLLYPGLITGICQLVLPAQANGSLVTVNGKVVGSSLIGQTFTRPEYFHSRPSAAGASYDAGASGGSNLGPTSQKLIDRIKAGVSDFRKENPEFNGNVPADIVTTSASGLDPQISPAAAEAQISRVAKARGIAPERLHLLIEANTTGPDLGILGEPGVNVLMLNIALDKEAPGLKQGASTRP